ncbi:MAG: transporter substrate-binding domain-containing protein [Sneathiella sp.]|nr:transporter substrate-binding domain-containing protein [Sneathiella sp.]
MKIFHRLFFAMIFCVLGMNSVRSDPLLIVADISFAPFSYKDEKGSAAGLHVDITKGALEYSGIEYEIQLMPWKRIIELSDAGGADISLPWRHKPERFEKYHMIGPFTDKGSGTYFWSHLDSTVSWKDLQDLRGTRIAAISGFAYPSSFENADYLTKTFQTGNTEMLVRFAAAKRFDLVLSDETVFMAAARKLKMENKIKRVGPSLEQVRRYAVVPKQKPDVARKITAAFEAFRNTPRYREIINAYMK